MSSRHRGRRSALPAPVLALAIVAIAFFALPLVGLLWRAPWSSAWSYLTDDGALTALRLSVVCSLWATGLSIVFGVPLAWLLARVEFRGRGAVRALCTLSMVLPPVVGGVALFFALGRRGLVGQYLDRWFDIRLPFTTAGVVVAQTFVAMPFLVITVEASLRQMDTRFEDASRTLGASRWYTFRRVTVPAIGPALGAGAVLAWARALGEFGATITFAGNFPGKTQTMPLAVYLSLETNPEEAILLSIRHDRDLLHGAPRPARPVARTGRPTDGGVRGMTLSAQIGLQLGTLDLEVELDVQAGRAAGAARTERRRQEHRPAMPGRARPDRHRFDRHRGLVVDDPATDTLVEAEDRPIGFVFQNYLLFDHMSVLENVAFGLRARKTPKADARRTAREWLDRVGLAEYADQRPRALSGGQAQRVALARALATSPRLLLLDEPLAALDAGTRASVRRDLRRHLETFDGMRLLVTHDPVDAYALADRVAILDAGRVVQVGTLAEVTAHPRIALRRRPGRGQPGGRQRRRTASSPPRRERTS